MFEQTISPVLVTLFGLEIRYYGLVYALGFIASYFALTRWVKMEEKDAESLLIWFGAGMLIGSRVTYYVFYAQGWSLIDILQIWNGGMSFHGALIGMLIAGIWWQKHTGKNLWRIADNLAVVAAFFLALGRVANFVNSEIVGTVTDAAWCVRFPQAHGEYAQGCRHPVQLYAMLKNLFIGGVLLWMRPKTYKDGFIFWNFVGLYGVLRFSINFLRADPVIALGWLKTGHVLSLIIFCLAAYMLWSRHKKDYANLLNTKHGE